MENVKTYLLHTLLSFILASSLIACNKTADLPPAPLDSKSGLESLASAYSAVSNKLPMPPSSMKPSARKQFIIDVFTKANFSYAKTLASFQLLKDQTYSKNIKDLAELISFPHKNISSNSQTELYTEIELKAVQKIDKIAY